MAVDATGVDRTNGGHDRQLIGAVLSAPLAGGEPTTLATGQETAIGIATDGSVYWIDAMMIPRPVTPRS